MNFQEVAIEQYVGRAVAVTEDMIIRKVHTPEKSIGELGGDPGCPCSGEDGLDSSRCSCVIQACSGKVGRR